MNITHDGHGICHVHAADTVEAYRGLGRCHATDRGLQMLLMRILGRGRASEFLDSSDELLEVDLFFRRMNWSAGGGGSSALSSEAAAACAAYCEGVNEVFNGRAPWELRLMGYRPDPWSLEDVFLLARIAGYVTLAQSQAEMERMLVEWVQRGVPRDHLEELFPGHLGFLDEELLKKVRLEKKLIRDALFEGAAVPRMMASNNWVVSGSRTASGKPILANDPHLEVNRLPNVWYEVVLETPGRVVIGATMPGLPGIIVGRSPELAWGITYTFMDTVDSWVEHCRDGKYRRGGDDWYPFGVRREVIQRKKKPPVERTFYENDHGVLEGDPSEEGYLLATRWSAARSGTASIDAFYKLFHARTVEEGREAGGRVESAWNIVFADRDGSIGYQMSGLMPKRREGASGLVPLPGWDPRNDWQGFVDPQDLPRVLNPERGFIVTANQDLNALGRVAPINLPMGAYRADRIAELLEKGEKVGIAEMCAIQQDLHSTQAEEFMKILRPLLPDTPEARSLKEWDGRYDPESKGASLFESVYRELFREVFGAGLGRAAFDHLWTETGTFTDFYLNFDRVLLSAKSVWTGGKPREDPFRRAIEAGLKPDLPAWGESQKVILRHLLFGGKFPRFFGFDRGPITIKGGRATVHQGQVYRNSGRTTTFAPGLRFVTDLADDKVHSCICGGPSDRRFSGRYASEVEAWLEGRYKTLGPNR